jgi:hypothetical protein
MRSVASKGVYLPRKRADKFINLSAPCTDSGDRKAYKNFPSIAPFPTIQHLLLLTKAFLRHSIEPILSKDSPGHHRMLEK